MSAKVKRARAGAVTVNANNGVHGRLAKARDDLTPPGDNPGQSCRFPTQALPPAVRDVVKAVSEIYRVPEPLAACCALAVTSAAIGKGLKVSSIPGKTAPANLYILAGVESGGGKSLVFDTITKPLFEYQKELNDNSLNEVLPTASAEKMAAKQPAVVDAGDAQVTPPTLVCENITSEALANLLSNNQECLASLSADARDVMDIVGGRYRRGGKGDEGLYLKAFSEDPCVIHRATRPSIRLNGPNLTCLWLVQPDKVDEIFSKKFASEGGLLPRFLVCQANCRATPIDRTRVPVIDEPLRAWRDLVTSLLEAYRHQEERITINPTARAVKLLDKHHDGLVDRRNGDLQDINSYVARWNEQAWRLALVLHAAQWGPKASSKRLSDETAKNAITIADWFAGQQLAKLRNGREAAQQQKTDAVVKLLLGKPAGIKAKDVCRKRIAPTTEEAHEILAELEGQGLLAGRDVCPEGGGKPSRIYTLVMA